MCGGVRSDAGLVEQLRCELAGERLDVRAGFWGTWLLTTDDPDGGAHAGGYFMLALAAVGALVLGGAALLRKP